METQIQSDLTIIQLRKALNEMSGTSVISWSIAVYWHPVFDQPLYTLATLSIPSKPKSLNDYL